MRGVMQAAAAFVVTGVVLVAVSHLAVVVRGVM